MSLLRPISVWIRWEYHLTSEPSDVIDRISFVVVDYELISAWWDTHSCLNLIVFFFGHNGDIKGFICNIKFFQLPWKLIFVAYFISEVKPKDFINIVATKIRWGSARFGWCFCRNWSWLQRKRLKRMGDTLEKVTRWLQFVLPILSWTYTCWKKCCCK